MFNSNDNKYGPYCQYLSSVEYEMSRLWLRRAVSVSNYAKKEINTFQIFKTDITPSTELITAYTDHIAMMLNSLIHGSGKRSKHSMGYRYLSGAIRLLGRLPSTMESLHYEWYVQYRDDKFLKLIPVNHAYVNFYIISEIRLHYPEDLVV